MSAPCEFEFTLGARTQPRVNRIGVLTERGREFESFLAGGERKPRGCVRASESGGANRERGGKKQGHQAFGLDGFVPGAPLPCFTAIPRLEIRVLHAEPWVLADAAVVIPAVGCLPASSKVLSTGTSLSLKRSVNQTVRLSSRQPVYLPE